MKLRANRNCHALYNLEYHLILVTKYCHPCITEEMFQYLKQESERIFTINNIILEEMNYEPDHVHILISCPPEIRISGIINGYKTATSRHIRAKFADDLKKWYWKPYFWSGSYMILSSGGAPIDVIKKYIQEQGTPQHKQKSHKA